MTIPPTLVDWFARHKHLFLIAVAALIVGILGVFVVPLTWQPRNLYRILIACPQGNVVLGPRNVTNAVIGAHSNDRGVVELWIGVNQAALAQLETLSGTSTSQECHVLLGEIATVRIDLAHALNDDVLTINEVPTKFAERFVAAFDASRSNE